MVSYWMEWMLALVVLLLVGCQQALVAVCAVPSPSPPLWRIPDPALSPYFTSIAASSTHVYACAGPSLRAYAVSASSDAGSLAWSVAMPAAAGNCQPFLAPAVGASGTVYFATYTTIAAVSPPSSTLQTLFNTKTDVSDVPSSALRISGFTLHFDESALFINLGNAGLYSVSIETASALWSTSNGTYAPFAPWRASSSSSSSSSSSTSSFLYGAALDRCSGDMYVVKNDGTVYSVWSQRPALRWKTSLPLPSSPSSCAVSSGHNGRAYVVCALGTAVAADDVHIYALETANGTVVASATLPKGAGMDLTNPTPHITNNGTLVIGSTDGSVYFVSPAGNVTAAPAASTSVSVGMQPFVACRPAAVWVSSTVSAGGIPGIEVRVSLLSGDTTQGEALPLLAEFAYNATPNGARPTNVVIVGSVAVVADAGALLGFSTPAYGKEGQTACGTTTASCPVVSILPPLPPPASARKHSPARTFLPLIVAAPCACLLLGAAGYVAVCVRRRGARDRERLEAEGGKGGGKERTRSEVEELRQKREAYVAALEEMEGRLAENPGDEGLLNTKAKVEEAIRLCDSLISTAGLVDESQGQLGSEAEGVDDGSLPAGVTTYYNTAFNDASTVSEEDVRVTTMLASSSSRAPSLASALLAGGAGGVKRRPSFRQSSVDPGAASAAAGGGGGDVTGIISPRAGASLR